MFADPGGLFDEGGGEGVEYVSCLLLVKLNAAVQVVSNVVLLTGNEMVLAGLDATALSINARGRVDA